MKMKLEVKESWDERFILIHVIDSDKECEVLKRIQIYLGVDKLFIFRDNYALGNKIIIELKKGTKDYLFAQELKLRQIDFNVESYKGVEFPHPLECDYSNLEEVL